MDDFVISNLHEARNEWCSRLVSIFTPLVVEGLRSIFNESWKMCVDTDELSKYLMTFQNLLTRVPKWNTIIVEQERTRIIERSGCNYLDDLITCVHIIQLKVLTSMRVGNKQKKIDISIPKLDHFIHKVYIHAARKIYTNVYLFEKNISPLQIQKNGRELELIVQECIMTTIRESIPTEAIIRAYMDESEEQEEEVFIETVKEPVLEKGAGEEKREEAEIDAGKKEETPKEEVIPPMVPTIQNIDNEPVRTKLSFDHIDRVMEDDGIVKNVESPKTLERLEAISAARAFERKQLEEDEDEDKIKILDDSVDLGALDGFFNLDESSTVSAQNDSPFIDFEEL